METFQVRSTTRMQMINITPQVEEVIRLAGVSEGVAVVFVPHTTAGITINEAADPSVVADITTKLRELVPESRSYTHAEGNSDSHIKTLLTGNAAHIIISQGSPALGVWQGVFFCEYDGPRTRKVHVQILG
jgi:secondary thiamine-phosphate synthase enzyme